MSDVKSRSENRVVERVMIYIDTVPDDGTQLLLNIVKKVFEQSSVDVFRGASIIDALYEESAGDALHLVFSADVSSDFIMLANKLVVKHGAKSVLFIGYNLTELRRIHVGESALWVYTTLCAHPKSIKDVELNFTNMTLPKNEF